MSLGLPVARPTRLTAVCSAVRSDPVQLKPHRPQRRVGEGPADFEVFSDHCRPGFRANVGVCVFNSKGLVFAGRTQPKIGGYWQLPQGGRHEGETVSAAARRELQEESGITSVREVTTTDNFLCYKYKRPKRVSRTDENAVRYEGQCQKWVLMEFEGQDAEINIFKTHEFIAWRWMPLGAICVQVPTLKQQVYVEMASVLAPQICALTGTVEPLTGRRLQDAAGLEQFRKTITFRQSSSRQSGERRNARQANWLRLRARSLPGLPRKDRRRRRPRGRKDGTSAPAATVLKQH